MPLKGKSERIPEQCYCSRHKRNACAIIRCGMGLTWRAQAGRLRHYSLWNGLNVASTSGTLAPLLVAEWVERGRHKQDACAITRCGMGLTWPAQAGRLRPLQKRRKHCFRRCIIGSQEVPYLTCVANEMWHVCQLIVVAAFTKQAPEEAFLFLFFGYYRIFGYLVMRIGSFFQHLLFFHGLF